MVISTYCDVPSISAQTVGADVRHKALQYIQDGLADPNHISIYLYNFASPSKLPLYGGNGPDHPSSFFVLSDNVDASHYVGLDLEHDADIPFMQPWLLQGIPKVRQWFEDFVAEYRSPDPGFGGLCGPVPARFHFGSETYLTKGGRNGVINLKAVANDSRWPSRDVPGFPVGTTMEALWHQAWDHWGSPPNYPLLQDLLRDDLGSDRQENRRYMLWYEHVCQQVEDAAMKAAAYDVIKDNWPECKVSNYQDMNADGADDDFGWHSWINRDDYPGGTAVARRLDPRGTPDLGGWGDWNYWGDYFDPTLGEQTPHQGGHSAMLIHPGKASGDFSAPGLYNYNIADGAPDTRKNYYLPPRNSWPAVTVWEESLFAHRRTVESVHNTPGQNPSKFAPWVKAINMNDGQHPTQIEFLDQLAMLRAKKVPELKVWWDDPDPSNPATIGGVLWGQLHAVLDGAYRPQLNWYALYAGSQQTGMDTDCARLRFTIRDPGHDTYDCTSGLVNGSPQIVLLADVTNAESMGNLRLNFECLVDDPSILGSVYVFDGSAWHLDESINDEPNHEFGFYAPLAVLPSPIAGYYETRRTFDLTPIFFWNHELIFKIVLRQPSQAISTGFHAKFDLVQVVGTYAFNPTPIDNPPEDMVQGADYDHSKEVTTGDAAAFLLDYANAAPLADFNMDGVVDVNDLIAFLVAYGH
jgi:hypothetical protein